MQWVDVEEPELPLPGDRWLARRHAGRLLQGIRAAGCHAESLPSCRATRCWKCWRKTFRRIGARLFRRDLTDAELIAQRREHDQADRCRRRPQGRVSRRSRGADDVARFSVPRRTAGQLDDFALASRLSYFLWNSTPDEELLEVARKASPDRSARAARADRANAERSAFAAVRREFPRSVARPVGHRQHDSRQGPLSGIRRPAEDLERRWKRRRPSAACWTRT